MKFLENQLEHGFETIGKQNRAPPITYGYWSLSDYAMPMQPIKVVLFDSRAGDRNLQSFSISLNEEMAGLNLTWFRAIIRVMRVFISHATKRCTVLEPVESENPSFASSLSRFRGYQRNN